MTRRVPSLVYHLQVINGYKRPIFAGMDAARNTLMWELLAPSPVCSAKLLEDVERVARSESEGWAFESPQARIICTPETLVLEDAQHKERAGASIRIELPLKEVVLLMWEWLFECVWREPLTGQPAGTREITDEGK